MDSIKYLDTIGIETLFSAAKGRDRFILLCLYDMGCRVGELVTTRVSDIDFKNGFIRIESSRTKTKHFRAVRVSQTTLEAIKKASCQGRNGCSPAGALGTLASRPCRGLWTAWRRGRDPGDFAQEEAQQEKGYSTYPKAQPYSLSFNERRAFAYDPEAGGSYEALYDRSLCYCSPCAGEGGV